MKIDRNTTPPNPPIARRESNHGAISTGPVHKAGTGEDTATRSQDLASVDALTSQALASPDQRQDKVDALRQAITGGQYKVEPAKVAEAILQESPKL